MPVDEMELDHFIDPDDDDADTETHDRFKVVVEFMVEADSEDDAIMDVKTIIDEGIVSVSDNEERTPIASYDVTESEPAEVD